MKVTIDGEFEVECDGLNGTWNGWVRPLFTREQLDLVRDAVVTGGWDLTDIDGGVIPSPATMDMTTLDYVTKWDTGLYEICGWVWELVEVSTTCEVLS